MLRQFAESKNTSTGFFVPSVTSVEDGETIIKTCSDCWVVGKKSDQREFYVVLNQKNANLIEINGKRAMVSVLW